MIQRIRYNVNARGDIMKADLHIHTTHSDGTKSQREIFDLAKKQNLDYISITDHDTCINIEESKELSKEYGINFIPGIELSTLEEGKPVHVLGYFRDDAFKGNEMISYYKRIKEGRENRTHHFIEKLKNYFDIEITYEEVFAFSKGIIARPHIAKAIHQKYPQYSFDYIFDNFIGDHSKAFVPSSKLSVQEGIDLLRRNNCIVVLAHPTLLKKSIKEKVLSYNFDGFEARYFRNLEDEENIFKDLAQSRGMITTAGSDFHGIENDSKHGHVGQVVLDDVELEKFLLLYNQ